MKSIKKNKNFGWQLLHKIDSKLDKQFSNEVLGVSIGEIEDSVSELAGNIRDSVLDIINPLKLP